jgi:DNA-binding PadR family transcriptional regulator
MSVTRLLVLGALRIFQPTHGYVVRRELASWQVAEWAHLNPGSVYNALRALTKDGLLVEEHAGAPDAKVPQQVGGTGSRTEYRLTTDGEQEFLRLVREALWQLHPFEPGWLLAGMSFWGALTRDEVLAALEARTALLAARISEFGYAAASFPSTAAGTPDHVVEHFHIHAAQLRGELEWVQSASERIRSGVYGFSGEDPLRLIPRAHWPKEADSQQ